MKKRMNKAIILSLVLMLTACNNWLDVSPKSDMKADDLFLTEAGFRDGLIGVYALMCREDSYARDLTYGYLDVLAQYYKSPHQLTSSGYEHNFKKAAEYNYKETAEEARILAIWQNHFTAIANINLALEYIDKKKDVFSSEDIYKIYKGEFLALRAFLHFDMLRLFASSASMDNGNGLNSMAIPYVDVYTNVARPQLTVKEVLEKVKTDLLAAKGLMKGLEVFKGLMESSDPQYNRGQRMNYYAVTALLARVYLYGNERELALAQAKEIIGEVNGENPTSYELANSSATSGNPMFSSELIFTLDVQKLKDLSEVYFTENSNSVSSILSMSSSGKANIFNSGGLESDFRSSWMTLGTDGDSYVLGKYKDMKYIPMFKLSELYLIAAETATGREAYGYLNKLRNHRGLANVAPTADLEDNIFQEYRREFIGEGQMFFYYKRKVMQVIGADNNIAIKNPNAIYNLPIPTNEVDFGNIKK